jgi:hypothetical protein
MASEVNAGQCIATLWKKIALNYSFCVNKNILKKNQISNLEENFANVNGTLYSKTYHKIM